jgi:predicted RNA polymerase sigma factor
MHDAGFDALRLLGESAQAATGTAGTAGAVGQRLGRAKARIRQAGIPLVVPLLADSTVALAGSAGPAARRAAAQPAPASSTAARWMPARMRG